MADEKEELTRREAIKTIGVGVGVIANLPVLGRAASAQEIAAHDHSHNTSQATGAAKSGPLKFFTEEENKTVIEMSERIIPADDHSPGAKAAGVAAYIDLIINESPDVTKNTWREGLAAINKMSHAKFDKPFVDSTADQQTDLLKEISKNEKSPQTV